MSATAWFAKRTGPRARDAWVGVHSHVGGLAAARAAIIVANRRPRVQACHRVDTSQGLPALQQWWAGFGSRRVGASLLLRAHEYQILQIEAPAVEPAEVRSAARWQIQDLIDFPADEAALDCLQLPAAPAGQQRAKLLAVVARQALVQQNVTQWRSAGLALNVIDIPELALRNLAVLASGAQACAFVHIGLDETHLILLWQEELCVSRQLAFGGLQLRALDDFPRGAQLERLGLEIQRTVDAFGRQFSAAHLTQLWVSAVHDVEDITRLLADQLSMQVQAYRLADWIDLDPGVQPMDLDQRVDHTLAIGAALREEVAS
jgi:MSHA biogenesis protein MshI